MLTSSDIKHALRAAGYEIYRTQAQAVHLAERIRENLIMDSWVRVHGGESPRVVFLVRTQKADFPGETEEELFARARILAQPAIARDFVEARSFVTELPDPGQPSRILDHWYQLEFEKAVADVELALEEVRFVFPLAKASKR